MNYCNQSGKLKLEDVKSVLYHTKQTFTGRKLVNMGELLNTYQVRQVEEN